MKHLLLLHGAIGSKDQLLPLANALSSYYHVHVLNFPGHGGEAFPEEFTIPLFAAYVIKWMKENGVSEPTIFGYSMGGYVAMYMASHYPNIAEKIITLGTKYHWTVEVAQKETGLLNPDVIEAKLPAFAAQLQKQHGASGWKILLQETASMLLEMGQDPPLKKEDIAKINNEVLVVLGDRDKMVALDETLSVYKSLQAAQLCILPGAPHAIEKLNVTIVAEIIKAFIR